MILHPKTGLEQSQPTPKPALNQDKPKYCSESEALTHIPSLHQDPLMQFLFFFLTGETTAAHGQDLEKASSDRRGELLQDSEENKHSTQVCAHLELQLLFHGKRSLTGRIWLSDATLCLLQM